VSRREKAATKRNRPGGGNNERPETGHVVVSPTSGKYRSNIVIIISLGGLFDFPIQTVAWLTRFAYFGVAGTYLFFRSTRIHHRVYGLFFRDIIVWIFDATRR